MATYTSPFAASFKSAIKRGTSYNVAVNNIAARSNKTPQQVWESLYKAELCFRQKFNGQWVYVPWDAKKANATTCKNSQFQQWQWFTEWCINSNWCTPEKMYNHTGSQKDFMTWCRKYFGKQFNWTNATTSKSRRTTKTTSNYRFNTTKSKTGSRWAA